MFRARIAAATTLFLIFFAAGQVFAEALPPEERRSTGPCMGEEAFSRSWLDRTHAYITSTLCQPSVWFDGFFGEHRAGEDWAGSLIRWQGSFRLDEQDGGDFRSTLDANLRLPRMNDRLKLIITSQSGSDESRTLPDDDPYGFGSPDDTPNADKRQTAAGFRYYLTDTRTTRMDIGAGLKLSHSVQPYVRFRLRFTQPLSSSTLVRLTPTVIWLREEGVNRSLRIDLEQRMSENILVRGSHSVVRRELEPGVSWGTSLTMFDRLSMVTVLALEAAAQGHTFPDAQVLRYRLAARVRSNFLRDWLFMEVEPEYYWPRDSQGEYHLFRAITFRLEAQFYS